MRAFDIAAIIFFSALLVLVGAALSYGAFVYEPARERWREACEAAGGRRAVLRHEDVCLRKDVFIDVPNLKR